ncbi:hypothetical protein [uncultured Gemmiger sp.]|uniref:hypothetical protein n=1 Tax=uncultured Gemmiger sp. TaxID=1623490 RepID=UPI002665293A|nr:hypothetical protein [uncultured Gemmiger sp.]
MKKQICTLLGMAVLLSSCGAAQTGQASEGAELAFPQTRWDMNRQQVMEACGVTEEDTLTYSGEGRGTYFSLGDYEIFGARAEMVSFSFINLKLGESGDLLTFDEESLDGQEVLAAVYVQYPAGTDMTQVQAEMDKLYGDFSLPEITQFPMYSTLDTGTLNAQKVAESDTQKVWGTDTVAARLGEGDASFFRENWPLYQPDMTVDDWETFSGQARLVTVVGDFSEQNPSIRFDAYPMAVYRELESRQQAG